MLHVSLFLCSLVGMSQCTSAMCPGGLQVGVVVLHTLMD